MWEMIEQMASNRLWIYTALAGSVFGAGFLFWFKDTRMATWAVQKFDATLEYLAVRWGWTWLQDDPDAAQGRLRLDDLKSLLDQTSDLPHGRSSFCAPPDGLILDHVNYG